MAFFLIEVGWKKMKKDKKIISMNNKEAKKFLLKGSSYCNLELPSYFKFEHILADIIKQVDNRPMQSFYNNNIKPNELENVNYKMINNKDGKYAWRPFEIIHPYLYVEVVEKICEEENWGEIITRFKKFSKLKKIKCCSIPLESKSKRNDKKESILNWWDSFEQETITKSIDFQYMACTDISNCYPSIYTHSIPWALYTKEVAKTKRDNNLIGNLIDLKIRNMQYGQTNGIPQGSILMDFIAELVLGYADELLDSELNRLNVKNYYILRYRDDYRIFTNNTYELEIILKKITEILGNLNFKLNTQKTFITDDIITNSIKKDKMYCFENEIDNRLNIQKKMMIIRSNATKFPNSGTVLKQLTQIYKSNIKKLKSKPNNFQQILAITIDIMYICPRTFPICSAILSKLLIFVSDNERTKYINKIIKKFDLLPNTDYLNIWLQRITILFKRDKPYESTLLCKKIYNNQNIWNSSWITSININENLIIDENQISRLKPIIDVKEVDFLSDYNNYY